MAEQRRNMKISFCLALSALCLIAVFGTATAADPAAPAAASTSTAPPTTPTTVPTTTTSTTATTFPDITTTVLPISDARDPFQPVTYAVRGTDNQTCATFTLAGQVFVSYFNSTTLSNMRAEINLPRETRNITAATLEGRTVCDISSSVCPDYNSGVWTSRLVVKFGGGVVFTLTVNGTGNSNRYSGPLTWRVSAMTFTYKVDDIWYFSPGRSSFTRSHEWNATGLAQQPLWGTAGLAQSTSYVCDVPGQLSLPQPNHAVEALTFSFKGIAFDPFNAGTVPPAICPSGNATAGAAVPGQLPPTASAVLALALLLSANTLNV